MVIRFQYLSRHLILCHLILCHLVLPYLTLSHLILRHVTLSYRSSTHLISPLLSYLISSKVDRVDLQRFPRFADQRMQHVRLEKGDVVYIPDG